MPATLKISTAEIAHQFEVFRLTGCDGFPTARVFDAVVVGTADGRTWSLPNGRRFTDEEDGIAGARQTYDAVEMLAKIQRRGIIRPEFWVEQEEQESFEERYSPYGSAWQEEQQGRQGWGV